MILVIIYTTLGVLLYLGGAITAFSLVYVEGRDTNKNTSVLDYAICTAVGLTWPTVVMAFVAAACVGGPAYCVIWMFLRIKRGPSRDYELTMKEFERWKEVQEETYEQIDERDW